MRRDKYRDSVSSRSDELNRDRRYIQQIMNKIRDKADREWEDYGRRPSHDDRMDDYYDDRREKKGKGSGKDKEADDKETPTLACALTTPNLSRLACI